MSPFTDTGIPEVLDTRVTLVLILAAVFGKLYVVSIKLAKSEPVGASPDSNAAFNEVIDIMAIWLFIMFLLNNLCWNKTHFQIF